MVSEPGLRIDKWLWHARFCKSRSIAQRLCGGGRLRLNGKRVTKAHVMAGAGSVIGVGSDGEPRTAQVVGSWGAEQNNDLALLLLEEKSGLEPIVIGSSRDLEVGDPVIAIGNALGRGLSVTVLSLIHISEPTRPY